MNKLVSIFLFAVFALAQTDSDDDDLSCFEEIPTPTVNAVLLTTEVVTALTTFCPAATQITHGTNTYTVTEATTLTINDCPCTVTRPVSQAPALISEAPAYANVTNAAFTTTTQIVATLTTYCPNATVLTVNQKTFTVNAPTTLTITDCPCTQVNTVAIGAPLPQYSPVSSVVESPAVITQAAAQTVASPVYQSNIIVETSARSVIQAQPNVQKTQPSAIRPTIAVGRNSTAAVNASYIATGAAPKATGCLQAAIAAAAALIMI